MSKILVIGDVHGEIERLTHFVKEFSEEKFDAVILVGDIGANTLYDYPNCTGRDKDIYLRTLETIFQLCTFIGEKVFFVPGNWDLSNLPHNPYPNVFNVDLLGDGEKQELDGRYIIGIGGSKYLNGMFPYEWDEVIVEKKINSLSVISNSDKPIILISHSPPFNTKVDYNFQNMPQGSRIINYLIEKINPTITLCGHIHEAFGLDVVYPGRPVINAGLFSNIDIIDKIASFDRINTVFGKVSTAYLLQINNESDIDISKFINIGSSFSFLTYKYKRNKIYKIENGNSVRIITTFNSNKLDKN